jgi:glycosyltransferase involved in cell wall biosynthesis
MPALKHLVFAVTNDLATDQRMQRAGRALSARFRVTLLGRLLPDSPPLPAETPFQCVRIRLRHRRGPAFYLEHNYRLYRWLLAAQPDIIGAVDADTLAGCALAARHLNVPLVYDSHEYFTQLPELEGRPWVRWVWDRVERWGVPQAALCYTVNESLAEVLAQRLGTPFGVVRNLPEPPSATATAAPMPFSLPEKFILYQGALNVGRGLEMLLDLLADWPEARAVLCGEGDISQALRAKAASLRLQERVQFLGRLSPGSLHWVTRRAWIGYNVLAPMGLSYYYSLANKFFDYLHAGVPSLSSDFPEYQKLVHRWGCGRLTRYDKEDVAHMLCEMWCDQAAAQRMQANARQAAAHLRWAEEKETLLRLYEPLE